MNHELPLWLLPVIGSALGLGFYDLCKKHAVRENSVMPVLFFATLCGSSVFVVMTLLFGDWRADVFCTGAHWLLVLLKSMLVASSWVCVYYAMRELPVSLASPIRASSPLWTFFGSLLLYSEVPTLLQAAGMISIFAGYYFFSVFGRLEGFSFRRSRGIHLILLGTLLGACSALYDKYLLGMLHIPRGTVQFWLPGLDSRTGICRAYLLVRTSAFISVALVDSAYRHPADCGGLSLFLCGQSAGYLYFRGLAGAPVQLSGDIFRGSILVS